MPPTNHLENKVRSAVCWYGGKTYLSRRILSRIPDHETYLEGFAGGANVLLNKYRAPREILCDLHPELIHFYGFLVQNTNLFVSKVQEIPYTRESFLWAKEGVSTQDPLERALKFFVRQNMSRGATGQSFSECTFFERNKNLPAWKSYQDDLPVVADRLRGVEIRLQSAFDAIDELREDAGALAYLDPPYYPSTRTVSQVYLHELTAFEHLRLLKKVQEFQGQVVLSGYANPTYDRELAGWDREVILAMNSTSNRKTKPVMQEILWIKPSWSF